MVHGRTGAVTMRSGSHRLSSVANILVSFAAIQFCSGQDSPLAPGESCRAMASEFPQQSRTDHIEITLEITAARQRLESIVEEDITNVGSQDGTLTHR